MPYSPLLGTPMFSRALATVNGAATDLIASEWETKGS